MRPKSGILRRNAQLSGDPMINPDPWPRSDAKILEKQALLGVFFLSLGRPIFHKRFSKYEVLPRKARSATRIVERVLVFTMELMYLR